MDNQSHEQGQGLGWFSGRWQKIFERLDKDSIALFARELAEKHPNEDKRKLARRVVRRSACLSAAVGLVTASLALIPGIGTAASIIAIVPEEYYLMRKQCEMVLEVAAIYGFDITRHERLHEIITLVGTPSRSIEALIVAKDDIHRMAVKAAVQLGSRSGQRALLGLKTASRGAVRRLPALGFLAGGAINYYSFSSLGNKSSRYYAHRQKESEK